MKLFAGKINPPPSSPFARFLWVFGFIGVVCVMWPSVSLSWRHSLSQSVPPGKKTGTNTQKRNPSLSLC